jgi:hypothetical protein
LNCFLSREERKARVAENWKGDGSQSGAGLELELCFLYMVMYLEPCFFYSDNFFLSQSKTFSLSLPHSTLPRLDVSSDKNPPNTRTPPARARDTGLHTIYSSLVFLFFFSSLLFLAMKYK